MATNHFFTRKRKSGEIDIQFDFSLFHRHSSPSHKGISMAMSICDKSSESVDLSTIMDLFPYVGEIWNRPQRVSMTSVITAATELRFDHRKCDSLPDEIVYLTNLRSLNCSICEIKSIPAPLYSLTNLEILILRGNQIKDTTGLFCQLTNLVELNLSHNQISSIPSEVTRLQSLKLLDLSHNQLLSPSASIPQLVNLRMLNIDWNKIGKNMTQFAIFIKEMLRHPSIDSISCKHNMGNHLFEQYWSLYKFKQHSASLTKVKLSAIPGWIKGLCQLRSLDLSSNDLQDIPDWTTQLIYLQSIELHRNKLSAFPPQLLKVLNLQRMNISGNKIDQLPDSYL